MGHNGALIVGYIVLMFSIVIVGTCVASSWRRSRTPYDNVMMIIVLLYSSTCCAQ
jgi:hypothetical protein